MNEYIFLDTWVLSEFTKDTEKCRKLAEFISANDLCVVADIFTFIEIYNPQWRTKNNDRSRRTIDFLSEQNFVLVDHQNVWDKVLLDKYRSYLSLPYDFSSVGYDQEVIRKILSGFLKNKEWWIKLNPHLNIEILHKNIKKEKRIGTDTLKRN